MKSAAALFVMAVTLTLSSSVWAQPGGPGGPGGRGGPGGGGDAFLLGMPEVQKELAISEDQKGLLEDMMADLRGGPRPDFASFRDLSQEERTKRFEEMRKQAEERAKQAEDALKAILDEKQFARYEELRLQRQGVMALTRPEMADKLALSEEQKEKLAALRPERGRGGPGGPGQGGPGQGRFGQGRPPGEGRPEQGQPRAEGRPNPEGNPGQPGGRPDFQAMMEEMQARREKQEAEILAVLTPDQKAKWDQMLGKKFEFPQPQFGGRPGAGRPGEGRPPGGRPESN